jgi:hypothetical protein
MVLGTVGFRFHPDEITIGATISACIRYSEAANACAPP